MKPVGIPNIGNSCFANAAIQMLFSDPVMLEHINMMSSFLWDCDTGSIPIESSFPIQTHLVNLYDELSKADIGKTPDSSKISNAMSLLLKSVSVAQKSSKSENFTDRKQHDSHEFLSILYEFILEECYNFINFPRFINRPVIQSYISFMETHVQKIEHAKYSGTYISECLNCGAKTFTDAVYSFLKLNFDEINSETVSLGEMLNKHFQRESWVNTGQTRHCESCLTNDDNRTVHLVTNTERLSDYLRICLLRFKSNNSKIPNTLNEIPPELYCGGSTYELKSVICHNGSTKGGHYYAFVKIEGEVFKMNDASVSKIPESSFNIDEIKRNVYILAYSKLESVFSPSEIGSSPITTEPPNTICTKIKFHGKLGPELVRYLSFYGRDFVSGKKSGKPYEYLAAVLKFVSDDTIKLRLTRSHEEFNKEYPTIENLNTKKFCEYVNTIYEKTHKYHVDVWDDFYDNIYKQRVEYLCNDMLAWVPEKNFSFKTSDLNKDTVNYILQCNGRDVYWDSVLDFFKDFSYKLLTNEIRKNMLSYMNNKSTKAFFFEMTPISRETLSTDLFQFVLLPAEGLQDLKTDANAFSDTDNDQMKVCSAKESIITFVNMNSDAILVVPCKEENIDIETYAHFATFVSGATVEQHNKLWQTVIKKAQDIMEVAPNDIWINTSGEGVHWLHVRLDTRPKYYHKYEPFTYS
jgi:ubiquitin C-terminal hydrolase